MSTLIERLRALADDPFHYLAAEAADALEAKDHEPAATRSKVIGLWYHDHRRAWIVSRDLVDDKGRVERVEEISAFPRSPYVDAYEAAVALARWEGLSVVSPDQDGVLRSIYSVRTIVIDESIRLRLVRDQLVILSGPDPAFYSSKSPVNDLMSDEAIIKTLRPLLPDGTTIRIEVAKTLPA